MEIDRESGVFWGGFQVFLGLLSRFCVKKGVRGNGEKHESRTLSVAGCCGQRVEDVRWKVFGGAKSEII